MVANRRISDIEMLVQRVQEENAILKKELHTSQNKLNNLQKVIERTNANHSKLVNETSMYKENANKLENEVLICKEEANQYSAQVCLLQFSKKSFLLNVWNGCGGILLELFRESIAYKGYCKQDNVAIWGTDFGENEKGHIIFSIHRRQELSLFDGQCSL